MKSVSAALPASLRQGDGDISNYVPDFVVKTTNGTVWMVETKGRGELDVPQKMAMPKQWCADATSARPGGGRGIAWRRKRFRDC